MLPIDLSDGSPAAAQKMCNQENDGEYQEHVDQRAAHVDNESTQPEQQQNQGNNPQHCRHPTLLEYRTAGRGICRPAGIFIAGRPPTRIRILLTSLTSLLQLVCKL